MINSYISILSELSRRRIKFVLAGGIACVLHGVERVTMDIDLSLLMSQENIKSFLNLMSELKMIPRAPVPAEFILLEENRRMMTEEKGALVFTFWNPTNPLMVIDVFLSENHDYDELSKDALTLPIEDFEIQIISIDRLISIKESINPPRGKDLLDIETLKDIRKSK